MHLDFTLKRRSDPVMPFGPYVGTQISKLPAEYLSRTAANSDVDNELRSAIMSELEARRRVA